MLGFLTSSLIAVSYQQKGMQPHQQYEWAILSCGLVKLTMYLTEVDYKLWLKKFWSFCKKFDWNIKRVICQTVHTIYTLFRYFYFLTSFLLLQSKLEAISIFPFVVLNYKTELDTIFFLFFIFLLYSISWRQEHANLELHASSTIQKIRLELLG